MSVLTWFSTLTQPVQLALVAAFAWIAVNGLRELVALIAMSGPPPKVSEDDRPRYKKN